MSTDPWNLERFVSAQDHGQAYAQALRELTSGRKTSHWMWFVLPQVAGLGHSPMAQRYAISGLDEAVAYLAHPVLGQRLRECARVLARLDATDPVTVMGAVDAQKLRSSMTLFLRAEESEGVPDPSNRSFFVAVLDRYFHGEQDEQTVQRL